MSTEQLIALAESAAKRPLDDLFEPVAPAADPSRRSVHRPEHHLRPSSRTGGDPCGPPRRPSWPAAGCPPPAATVGGRDRPTGRAPRRRRGSTRAGSMVSPWPVHLRIASLRTHARSTASVGPRVEGGDLAALVVAERDPREVLELDGVLGPPPRRPPTGAEATAIRVRPAVRAMLAHGPGPPSTSTGSAVRATAGRTPAAPRPRAAADGWYSDTVARSSTQASSGASVAAQRTWTTAMCGPRRRAGRAAARRARRPVGRSAARRHPHG